MTELAHQMNAHIDYVLSLADIPPDDMQNVPG